MDNFIGMWQRHTHVWDEHNNKTLIKISKNMNSLLYRVIGGVQFVKMFFNLKVICFTWMFIKFFALIIC